MVVIRATLGVSALALALASGWIGAPRAQDGAVTLQPILVEGDSGVVTEGSGTYRTDYATVGGKQPQDISEVPQTINVLTRQRLDDAGASTIEDAGYLLPGVTTALGDPFSGSLYARGQEVFQYYVDGAPRPYLSLYGTAPDLYFFDRMEVVSGPSGVFQGSGEPVGTLNLVRKRPTMITRGQAGAGFDSFGSYRAEADIGGAVTADGRIRARVAAYSAHKETFTDVAESEDRGGYGTLEIDVTERTTLAFGAIGESEDTLRFSGLPTFTDGTLIDIDRDTFVGAPFNNFTMEGHEGFAELEHEFDNGAVFKVHARRYARDVDTVQVLGLSAVDPTTNTFTLFIFARQFEERTSYVDGSLTWPFQLAGRYGELVAGADYRRTDQLTRQTFNFGAGVQNIFAFDPGIIPEPVITFPGVGPGFNLNTESEADEYGVYAQGRLEVIDGVKINLGGRFSDYDSSVRDLGRNTLNAIDEDNFAPYAGVTWDVVDHITLYASYAEIFQPQTQLQIGGSNVEPRIGRQVEGGVKGDFFGGRLSAQAAVYWINDENRAVADPNNVGFFVGTGEADTEGFELTIAGQPFPGWEVAAGYAYVDTDLTNDPSSEHSAVAFVKYTFGGGMLEGLSLGAGARAVSDFEIFDDGPGVTIEAPGYIVFDAYAGYVINQHFDVQLNVHNVFDNDYVERINETIRGTFFGEPLHATLKLTARW